MTVPNRALDAGQFVTQYELLRAQIIGTPQAVTRGHEPGQPRGIGLALLLREGMPGWLNAVEAVLRASLVPHAAAAGAGAVVPTVANRAADAAMRTTFPSLPWHDITILLASLVLSTRRPASVSLSTGGYRPWQ
ncbi:MAG: hypothetical protein HYU75_22900 [Betaproteobacteria bacterium]|nr:hypothetical protein [Betaproteobacteria bacterium]